MTLICSTTKREGAITQAAWVTRNDGGRIVETLCLCSSRGSLALWEEDGAHVSAQLAYTIRHSTYSCIYEQQQFDRAVETKLCKAWPITSMACLTRDLNDTRIAVSQADGSISVLRAGENARLTSIFSVQITGVGPIAIAFASTKARNVYVLGQDDMTWYVRRTSVFETTQGIQAHLEQ